MIGQCLIFILGLMLLYWGSVILIKGAVASAILFAVRPIIIAIILVGFATSVPEFFVSLTAIIKKSSTISLGNIIGSNIINISLVLGISAIIRPININKKIIKFELPYMFFSALIFWFLCMDGMLGKGDGIILVLILFVFLFHGIKNAKIAQNSNKKKKKNDNADKKKNLKKISKNILMIILGFIGLGKGADMVVKSAILISQTLGLSEAFIAISIVAFGTSLPELTTSIVAASKGESDISVGTILGSNIFNICMVMGAISIISPMTIDKNLLIFEFPCMVIASIMFLGVAFFKKKNKSKTRSFFYFIFCFLYNSIIL